MINNLEKECDRLLEIIGALNRKVKLSYFDQISFYTLLICVGEQTGRYSEEEIQTLRNMIVPYDDTKQQDGDRTIFLEKFDSFYARNSELLKRSESLKDGIVTSIQESLQTYKKHFPNEEVLAVEEYCSMLFPDLFNSGLECSDPLSVENEQGGQNNSNVYIYAEAASGLMVRIPKDQYPEWKKVQEQIKAGTYKPTEKDLAIKEELRKRITGDNGKTNGKDDRVSLHPKTVENVNQSEQSQTEGKESQPVSQTSGVEKESKASPQNKLTYFDVTAFLLMLFEGIARFVVILVLTIANLDYFSIYVNDIGLIELGYLLIISEVAYLVYCFIMSAKFFKSKNRGTSFVRKMVILVTVSFISGILLLYGEVSKNTGT